MDSSNPNGPDPPSLARWLLRRILPAALRKAVLHDVEVELSTRASTAGRRAARRWLWKQVLVSIWPAVRFRWDEHRIARQGFRELIGAGCSTVAQDVRFAVRGHARRPLFSGAVALTLALGIGANAAVFSVFDSLLLRGPPDLPDPDRIVAVYRQTTERPYASVSYLDSQELAEEDGVFDALAVRLDARVNIELDDAAERVRVEVVSPGYFRVMGITPFLGRAFRADEARVDAPGVLVLSYRRWRLSLGSDPAALGRVIRLNGQPFTVVGVAPRGFRAGRIDGDVDAWIPVGRVADVRPGVGERALTNRHFSLFTVVARLAPGVERRQAQGAVDGAAVRLEAMDPSGDELRRYVVLPGISASYSPSNQADVARFGVMLFGVVGLALLLACLNIANLLLIRGSERRAEIAMRRALGAGRWRLIQQLLTESLPLAVLGGLLGVAVFVALTPVLGGLEIGGGVRVRPTADYRVLTFGIALTAMTGLLVGVLPALRATSVDLLPLLKSKTPAMGMLSGHRLRDALVVGQVTVSVVLLMGSALLVRTLSSLHKIDPGFATEGVITARVDPGSLGYDQQRGWEFFDALLVRARALPGVTAASLTSELPLDPEGSRMGIFVRGGDPEPRTDIRQTIVDLGFFRAMGMTLVQGRTFDERDRLGEGRTVVINSALAERLWPGADPIGQGLSTSGPDGPFYEVIGVVHDHRQVDIRADPEPHLFWAFRQLYAMMSGAEKAIVARATDPAAVASALRQAVSELDAGLPVTDVSTMADRIRGHVRVESQTAALLVTFAVASLLLAMSGLYALVAMGVRQRASEIGLRTALGATPAEVMRLIVRRGVLVASVGIVLGLSAALGMSGIIGGFLYEVRSSDPTSVLAVAALTLGVALFASWVPSRSALRVDPTTSLRSE